MPHIELYPLIIAVIGVLMYALCANPKLVRIGEIILFCGFFWLVAGMAAGPGLHLPH